MYNYLARFSSVSSLYTQEFSSAGGNLRQQRTQNGPGIKTALKWKRVHSKITDKQFTKPHSSLSFLNAGLFFLIHTSLVLPYTLYLS
jgi:hypothetical protein